MPIVPFQPGDPAIAYVRLSTAEQMKGYNPRSMFRKCLEEIEALGLVPVGPMAFDPVTKEPLGPGILENEKGDDWERESFDVILHMAKQGQIRVMMGFDTGRVARAQGLRDWLAYQLREYNAQLRYATVTFDPTPEGKARDGMNSVFDEWEHAKIRWRTQNGLKEKRDRGEVVGSGRLNYGYEPVHNSKGRIVNYAPVEPEAGIVRRIVTELATDTLTTVCARLNADGVPTPGKSKAGWQPGTIRALLKRPIYLGVYRFGEESRRKRGKTWVYSKNPAEKVTEVAVPPIITYAQLALAQAGMKARVKMRRGRGSDADDPYTLRGLLRCASCDGVLSTSVTMGRRGYTCLRAFPRGCGVVTERCPLPRVPAEGLETLVWERFREAAFDLETVALRLAEHGAESAAAKRHAEQVAYLEEQIAKLTRNIKKWHADIEEYDDDSVSVELAREKLPVAERTLKAHKQSLREVREHQPSVLGADAIEAILAELARMEAEAAEADAPTRRRLLRQFGVRVTVGLGRRDAGDGVVLGRKHAYTLGFAGALDLGHSGNDLQGSFPLWTVEVAA